MKPYQPSLAAPARGVFILLAAVLLGGTVLGVLVSLLSTQVYLILVFPLVMGLLGGAMVAAVVRAGKIRNPGVAIAAAVMIGIIIYAAMWATDYIQFRNNRIAEFIVTNPGADPSQADAMIDTVLKERTGQTGFLGYLLYEGAEGVSVGRIGSQKFLNLGPVVSWIDWVVELIILLWAAVRTGSKPAYEPFCETCGRWYDKPQLLGTLGASRSKEVLNLVENEQYVKLGEELQSNPALPNIGVFMATSGKDCTNGDVLLVVRSQNRDSRGNPTAKDLARGMILAVQSQELQRGIQNRRALYGN
jgi:hypothetical protein